MEKELDAMASALMPLMVRFADMVAARVNCKVAAEITPPEPKYYNRVETAKILHITLPTLHNLTKAGRIHAQKVGGRVLYGTGDIDALVASGEQIKYVRKGGWR